MATTAPLAKATITIKYINDPKPGAKNSSIKDDKDDFYLIDPAMAQGLQQGVSYNVSYRPNTWRGTVYKMVEKIEPASNFVPHPAAGPAPARGKYGVDDKVVAERIYVCGILNAAMSNPNVNPESITTAWLANMTSMARDAWMQTFGKHNTELNDEIPF